MSQGQSWSKSMNVARAKRRPPTAPTRQELKIYQGFLKTALGNKKNTRIWILGITPELRELAFRYTKRVTSVDISASSIKIFQDATKIKNKNEVIIQADWLKTKFPDNHFDVVMSDASFANLNSCVAIKKLLKNKQVFE